MIVEHMVEMDADAVTHCAPIFIKELDHAMFREWKEGNIKSHAFAPKDTFPDYQYAPEFIEFVELLSGNGFTIKFDARQCNIHWDKDKLDKLLCGPAPHEEEQYDNFAEYYKEYKKSL